MVSISEGVMYYCTVFFTALIFLTEASAITTNYEKSTTFSKTNESYEISPQRTKLALARGSRSNLSKNQNQERVDPIMLNKVSSNIKLEIVPQNQLKEELLIAANSGGENNVKDKGGGEEGGGGKGENSDDDDQKTLSQQVIDGKYGLIQNEIFTMKPERSGIISYDVNPEVPKDNINNLGGLEPDDIWLAENHLLVLAGGGLNSMQNQWRPIDNYIAPQRLVQLPLNPKVPPPFPVQLTEDGPIEYIKSKNQPENQFVPLFNPLLSQYQNINKSQGYRPSLYGKLPYDSAAEISPLRPQLKPPLFGLNINAPIHAPIYVKPPPGADFIPPYLRMGNQSEILDEDDPSLYYPPPYDFYYPKDNTSKIPPGPLVPGIVLPPPPNFFSLMINNTKSRQILKPTDYKSNQNHKTGKQLQYSNNDDENKKFTTNKPLNPTTFITFNDIINDVTYPDTNDDKITYADVKVNKVSTEEIEEDWIPIPAPQPFYITGKQKPLKSTVLIMMDTPQSHGYNYDKPQNSFKISSKKPTVKYLQFVDKPDKQFPSTTPSAPQIISTKPPVQHESFTTTPISPYQPLSNTIKATYYFYEEPQFVDIDSTKSTYTTNSPLSATPVVEFNNYLQSKPVFHKTKSKENDTREKKRRPITPMIPIYYLAELENIVDLVKPMKLPYPSAVSTPKNEFYTTTAKPSYTIKKPNYERPTPKPIFEYNYIASSYNDAVNQNEEQHSTSQPTNYGDSARYPADYNTFYNIQSQPQYSQEIFDPIGQYNKPVHHTTDMPILYLHDINHYPPQNVHSAYESVDRPWIPNLNPYSQISYSTENPYYAFFTKEEEDLIDENTKKYFTIFGQKIKQNFETTSPFSVHTPASTTVNGWKTKYAYSGLPSQSSTSSYGPYSSTKTHHKKPSNYAESNTNKPLSLEGDTLVNYVTPSPTENPDAEYIVPKVSKHIRPIVVEDLPTDVNERLKNIMNLQSKQKISPNADAKLRYVLVNDEYDNRPYPQNLINTYNGKYTTEPYTASYSRHRENTAPISLESDIRVNYQSTKLKKDPDAEYLTNSNEHHEEQYENSNKDQESRNTKPISLQNDILVNYKQKGRYTTNPDAEYIDSSEKTNPRRGSSSSNVISYKYPGVEHGHFYFLTPQETHLTEIENERYDFQSDVERPSSSYFKRISRKQEQSTQISTKT